VDYQWRPSKFIRRWGRNFIPHKEGNEVSAGLEGRERGGGFGEDGSQSPPHQLGGLGERCEAKTLKGQKDTLAPIFFIGGSPSHRIDVTVNYRDVCHFLHALRPGFRLLTFYE